MSNDNKYISSKNFTPREESQIENKEKGKIQIQQEKQEAIEFYTRLCLKTHSTPNNVFLNVLKGDKMNIYLEKLNTKEIGAVAKTLDKFAYFKAIHLSLTEPSSISLLYLIFYRCFRSTSGCN